MNMDIKDYNKLVMYCLGKGNNGVAKEKKRQFDDYIKINKDYIYSKIFFEYSQLRIDNKNARTFLQNAIKNKIKLEESMKDQFDFRVAFLDHLIRNRDKITQVSEPRIIEEKIFERLHQLIIKDELTCLYNYRYYNKELIKVFASAIRHNHNFSLALIDIDNFKSYNDNYGHKEGNYVLKRIGKIILDSVRITDIPCRYGGEEFILILPQTGKKGAFILCEKIRSAVEKYKFKQKVTLSGGIAEFPKDTIKNDQTLFEYADKALYKAKAKGKNLIIKFSKRILAGASHHDLP